MAAVKPSNRWLRVRLRRRGGVEAVEAVAAGAGGGGGGAEEGAEGGGVAEAREASANRQSSRNV